MAFDPIVNEFFETRPDLLNEIKAFEKRRGLKLLKKLSTDKDEINFFSWLGEIRFGLFFDKICKDLENDFRIENKRPDWLLVMNDQRILSEVLRLNTPEEEYREAIEFSRQLRKIEKENLHIPYVPSKPAKIIELEFLNGGQSKMVTKEEKYRDILQKHKLPFIICVAPTLEVYLSPLDFYDFLMGSKGFFARDENFGRNVTGILLNTPYSQFFYYHNERAEFQLAYENLDNLRPFLYGNDHH